MVTVYASDDEADLTSGTKSRRARRRLCASATTRRAVCLGQLQQMGDTGPCAPRSFTITVPAWGGRQRFARKKTATALYRNLEQRVHAVQPHRRRLCCMPKPALDGMGLERSAVLQHVTPITKSTCSSISVEGRRARHRRGMFSANPVAEGDRRPHPRVLSRLPTAC